jgi:hypothetical protein
MMNLYMCIYIYIYILCECYNNAPYNKIVHNIYRHAVAQLVEALHYKSEGRGFDSQLCH